ncbi:MAG: Na+/H+ antiporter NhaA [Chloroflexi bacterium]|nr:Na+/H+ antiporter NhaA [Chloroflexota bacterium]
MFATFEQSRVLVVIGLVLGKPLGITLFSWLAVRSGITHLPSVISWRHILGVAFLGGIGFTISLFVADLAFEAGPLASSARIGILIGSVIAGVAGYLVMRTTFPPSRDPAAVDP